MALPPPHRQSRTRTRAEEIQYLRQRSNELLPVSQLPNEILSAVFLLARSFVEGPQGRKPPSWVAITYVCRRWRAVAIAYPSLWCQISLDAGLSWLTTFTERSTAIPVCIQLNLQGWTPITHDLLTSVLPRTRTLRLDGQTDDFSEFLPHVVGAAPVLHHLILCHHSVYQPYSLPSPAKITNHCFRDKFTHLRSLELEGSFDLTGVEAAFFNNLTSFVARRITNVDNIRRILRKSRNLETVLLTGEHERQDYIPTMGLEVADKDPFSLPRARSIEVRSLNITYSNALLRGLNMPSVQRMALNMDADWYSFQAGGSLESLIASLVPNVQMLERNTCALLHLAVEFGSDTVIISYSSASGIDPLLSLIFHRPHFLEHHINFLTQQLFTRPSLTCVRSLLITERDRYDAEELSWHDPFLAFQDVETVTIISEFMSHNPPTLASMFPTPVICFVTEPDPMPLPRLKQVTLVPQEPYRFAFSALRHCANAPHGVEMVFKGCGRVANRITEKLGDEWDISLQPEDDSVIANVL
ncbi:hypothetical protein OF83DRAFT_1283445 [Amylostereum chailletii]|nr:hypothetical protein OF83DRAFT_1283445 [Amylostereum chailletii]